MLEPGDLPGTAGIERDAAVRVFDLSVDLLGSANRDGYFTALNPAWERALGFTREALMAQPFIEFVHPADREKTQREAARLADSGNATVDFQNRYARADGGWCWLRWRTEVTEDGYYFVARDVSERVAKEQRRRLLSIVVEGADDAVFTKTIDGVITSWNRAAEDLYGWTAEEAVGRSIGDLIVPPDRSEEATAIINRLLDGEAVKRFQTVRRTKSGSLIEVVLTATLLRDDADDAVGVGVIARSADHRRRRDREEVDALVWVDRIREAIAEGRISFDAQPIISLRGGPKSHELPCRLFDREGRSSRRAPSWGSPSGSG
jgi:PAS domain S-box-containing protein